MPAWLWPVASAIGTAVGTAVTNRANARMAREQMAFQERMSGSAIQRQRADLEAAGMNPALAYSLGGASSPGGSMAGSADVVGPAISNAMQVRMFREQLETAKATAQKTQYEMGKAAAEMTIAKAQAAPFTDGAVVDRIGRATLAEWENRYKQATANASVAEDVAKASLDLTRANADLSRAQVPEYQTKGQLWNLANKTLTGLLPNASSFERGAGSVKDAIRRAWDNSNPNKRNK